MRASLASLPLLAAMASCDAAVLPTPPQAPERCGFREGTALILRGHRLETGEVYGSTALILD